MKKRNSMNLGRSFLGTLLIMAFMFIGAQQANAQYLHPEEAQSVLDQKVSQLLVATQTPQLTAASSTTPSTQIEVEYVTGVATALKIADSVQGAIDNNHTDFLAKHPNYTAIATQYRNQTIALLEE